MISCIRRGTEKTEESSPKMAGTTSAVLKERICARIRRERTCVGGEGIAENGRSGGGSRGSVIGRLHDVDGNRTTDVSAC